MNGRISDEALEQYLALIEEKFGTNFSEVETYDFARCMRADGTYYGTRGKCKKGKEAYKGNSKDDAFTGSGGAIGKARKNEPARARYKDAKRELRVAEKNRVRLNTDLDSSTKALRMGAGARSGRARNELAKMEAQMSGKKALFKQMQKAEEVSRKIEAEMAKARDEAGKSKLQKLAEKAARAVRALKGRIKGLG